MKTKMPNIFIVEDDNFYATMIQTHLEEIGYRRTTIYNSGNAAIDELYKAPDIVILDYDLGDTLGMDVLKKIKSVNPNIQVIFLSGQENLEIAVSSLKYGAFDYVEKNNEAVDRLTGILTRVEHHFELVQEHDRFGVAKKILLGAVAVTLALFFAFKDQILQ